MWEIEILSQIVKELSARVMEDIAGQLKYIDEIAQKNTERVVQAFQTHRVSDNCFAPTTGYGYNDKGREVLNCIFADIMSAQSALVSTAFASGTHAITAALFASLRPGQTLLSVTGTPYDTLHGVIGISGSNRGTLKEYDISYAQIELGRDGAPDLKAISDYIKTSSTGAVLIQRSRGYSPRPALSISQIGEICELVHNADKSINIVVDNCYGEFVEIREPGNVGADVIAGSLTKNPGGGIVAKGGYVAGREDLVEAASNRLTAPGIGLQCGASPDGHRLAYQGLFMAPHIVAQSLKTAVFASRLFELMGYDVSPRYDEKRSDIIQMISLKDPQLLEKFCKGIQAASPVDSYITPVASQMPGYSHEVIMAAGTFIQGASIELTADAPMVEPYNVFLQGGLTFESGMYAVKLAATSMER